MLDHQDYIQAQVSFQAEGYGGCDGLCAGARQSDCTCGFEQDEIGGELVNQPALQHI